MEVPQKVKIELPYDSAIPLLGVHPDKTTIRKNACTPMFIAALFTIAKTWKQPECPLTHEWTRKKWYVYTMEYYSAIKKKERMPFAAPCMILEVIRQIVLSQKAKDTYPIISLIGLS